MSFAGQSLRVITGYDKVTGNPNHDLLFVAIDVTKMAGLEKSATRDSSQRRTAIHNAFKVHEVIEQGGEFSGFNLLNNVPQWRNLWLFTEGLTYEMLLRGHAKQSEPFRKWA
ncbi:hypothetical protein [Edwardsiella tarda]|uniref:hypothetical protein n=1 Tax=Edwardsiella tarda TaxID=636 RepID=UPI003B50CF4D